MDLWIWADLGGSGWIQVDLDRSGWIWMDLGGSGWICLDLDGFKWICVDLGGGIDLRRWGRRWGSRKEEGEGGGGPGRSWEELGGAENITSNFIMQNVQLLLFRIQ